MSKEHAYAYEAGYRDGSINYELEHCPACKNVADLQEALDENAKLRELVRDMYFVISTLEDANDEAVVRNAVMLDKEHFSGAMRELGVEVDQ